MLHMGHATSKTESYVEEAIRKLPNIGSMAQHYEIVTAPAASPIRRAVDAIGARVQSVQGDEWFIKAYYPDALPLHNLDSVADASEIAGDLGVAPRLIDRAPEHGVLAFEYLGEGWDWGRLDSLSSLSALKEQIELRRSIHDGPRFAVERDIFEEIASYVEHARRIGAPLPLDFDWLLASVEDAAKTLQKTREASVPAHGDGACSNIMVNQKGELRLIDFDVSGNDDPIHDLAAMLVEVCSFKEDVWEGVKIWSGHYDLQLFSKCMLYGIADDIRWGLWGLVLFQESPRQDVEFFKYGQWRLLRARMNIQDRDFELWCRSL